MNPAAQTFADRIVNVAVTGPLIRIELAALQAPTAQGQNPQLMATNTLVMPLDGFVASYGLLEAVVKQLIDSGVLKAQAPAAATPPAEDSGAQTLN